MGNYVPSLLPLRYDALIYLDQTIANPRYRPVPLIHVGSPDRIAAARDAPEDRGRGRDLPAVTRGYPVLHPASAAQAHDAVR